MTTYAYTRPTNALSAKHELDMQVAAVKAVAALFGEEITSTKGGGFWSDSHPTAHGKLDALFLKLEAGDTLIIPAPGVLATTPKAMLERASKLVGAGVRVIAASMAGELSIPTLRAYVTPFLQMEEDLGKAKAEILRQAAEHQAEMDAWTKEYEGQLMKLLMARGINLASLIRPADEAEIVPPDTATGQSLKDMRLELGLTGEQAGALLDPPINKSTVSRLETTGTGPALSDYRIALIMAKHKGKQAAGAKPNKSQIGHQELAAYAAAGIPSPAQEHVGRSGQ